MTILNTATDWAKAETFSSVFFVLFGLVFLSTSLGFWQFGKTEVAKAFVIPALVAGTLLLILGIGLVFSNQARLSGFPVDFNNDASGFIEAELARADAVLNQYQIAVFRVIPLIIAACAALILYVEAPIWRASLITTIAMMAVILLVDTNASARHAAYRAKLLDAQQDSA